MTARTRWTSLVDASCVAAFLVWLVWLPLPFGSVISIARVPLIAVPLLLCSVAALLRSRRVRSVHETTPAYRIWTAGALLLMAVVAVQLIPLPAALLRVVSPESHTIWNDASRVAAFAGVPTAAYHPVSIDPDGTRFELFRLMGLFAAFQFAALLLRTHRRRALLVLALGGAALFEVLYGVRQVAQQRFDIWGWKNTLMFHRVTGTFVNPNHYAHYVALAVPLMMFVVAVAWHEAGPSSALVRIRLGAMLEKRWLPVVLACGTGVGCVAAVLLAQSRGALLSLATGLFIGGALATRKRPANLALATAAGLIVLAAMVLVLGTERTIARFKPLPEEEVTLVGRRTGIETAIGVWRRFPLLGSGAGTFPRVGLLEQRHDLTKRYRHAHDDYVELAATTGLLGAGVAIPALFAGWVALLRMTFSRAAAELRWRRRAYQWAALVSVAIAMTHALIDFNFYIPSNPATLAAIAGAAVASYSSDDKRTRR